MRKRAVKMISVTLNIYEIYKIDECMMWLKEH